MSKDEAISAAVERRCPLCGAGSYGGGDRPRVKDGLVYRRRRCLSESCGIRFALVEGMLTENPILLKMLVAYHEAVAAGLGYIDDAELPGMS